MKKITLLLVDDHTLVRETWGFILNNDPRFEVVAECGTGEEAISYTQQLHPDIIIMDINMPGTNGIDATKVIMEQMPKSKIIGVSLHTQPMYARKMLQNGAMGYVTKNSSREEMFKAIEAVHKGKKYVCEEIKNIVMEQSIKGNDAETGVNALSQREIEVINYIKQGMSSKKIAESLAISVKTVEVHRYNILKKLNLKNAAALVNYINNSYLKFEM